MGFWPILTSFCQKLLWICPCYMTLCWTLVDESYSERRTLDRGNGAATYGSFAAFYAVLIPFTSIRLWFFALLITESLLKRGILECIGLWGTRPANLGLWSKCLSFRYGCLISTCMSFRLARDLPPPLSWQWRLFDTCFEWMDIRSFRVTGGRMDL